MSSRSPDAGLRAAWELLLRRAAGGPVRVEARGTSMLPFARAGDSFTIAPTPSPRVGDILLFEHRGALTVHRLVRITSAGYLLKGDANAHPDGLFPLEALLGRAVALHRAGCPDRDLTRRRERLLARSLALASLGAHRLRRASSAARTLLEWLRA